MGVHVDKVEINTFFLPLRGPCNPLYYHCCIQLYQIDGPGCFYGQEAVDKVSVSGKAYDLIFMDVRMPKRKLFRD
jgi:hypothetical protein